MNAVASRPEEENLAFRYRPCVTLVLRFGVAVSRIFWENIDPCMHHVMIAQSSIARSERCVEMMSGRTLIHSNDEDALTAATYYYLGRCTAHLE